MTQNLTYFHILNELKYDFMSCAKDIHHDYQDNFSDVTVQEFTMKNEEKGSKLSK